MFRSLRISHVEFRFPASEKLGPSRNGQWNGIFRFSGKFKVALNSMYRIFLNFAKSCVLSCLSKVDNIKIFHRAVFKL